MTHARCLVSLLAASAAWAQANPPLSCNAQAANTPLIRSEGVAERIGDVIIQCAGGEPTTAGSPIPQYTITVTLNSSVSSRIFAHHLSEALLIVDDAFPQHPNPANAPQAPDAASVQNLCVAYSTTACPMTATGLASGSAGGDYDGSAGRYNVFEGVASGFNSISFIGVPVDAPGPSGYLDLRLTNVRIDASQLAPAPFFLSPVSVFLGTALVTNSPVIAGYVTDGLQVTQTAPAPVPGTSYSTFSVTFEEGYSNAFSTVTDLSSPGPQNVPGYNYSSESGLWDTLAPPAGIPELGLATHGTRLLLRFSGYPAGVKIVVPAAEYLVDSVNNPTGGGIMYVSTDANGNSPTGPTTSPTKTIVAITNSQGNAWAAYEVVKCDPNTQESATIPILVESQSTGTVSASFAPLVAAGTLPIPRFVSN